jgi:hypothetical protein
MNYVPIFIPVLLALALIAVTLYRPPPAERSSAAPKAAMVCVTPSCR